MPHSSGNILFSKSSVVKAVSKIEGRKRREGNWPLPWRARRLEVRGAPARRSCHLPQCMSFSNSHGTRRRPTEQQYSAWQWHAPSGRQPITVKRFGWGWLIRQRPARRARRPREKRHHKYWRPLIKYKQCYNLQHEVLNEFSSNAEFMYRHYAVLLIVYNHINNNTHDNKHPVTDHRRHIHRTSQFTDIT